MPQTVQKLPCCATALPVTSPSVPHERTCSPGGDANTARQHCTGASLEGHQCPRGCAGAVPTSSCVFWLAASLAVTLVPAAPRVTNTLLCCAVLWSRWQSQTCPQLSLAAGWAHQLRARPGEVVAAEVARCPGAVSLPSLRECGTCCSAQVCSAVPGTALRARGWGWPVPSELPLAGTSPGELALPAGRLGQLTQILTCCCCPCFPAGCWIPAPQCVLQEQGAVFEEL